MEAQDGARKSPYRSTGFEQLLDANPTSKALYLGPGGAYLRPVASNGLY